MRDLDQKVGIIINAQIANEERFAALADSQAHADRRLDALIDIIQQRNGGTSK
jgi:hypothetical protein